MNALFIGRFQPFHNGHLKVIQDASRHYSKIIIGIGSSQYSGTQDNPFSGEERKIMIEKSLEKIGIKNFQIILIPDIHNPPKWVDHVLSIFSDFDVVLSNNSITISLFSEKGYKVVGTKLYKKNKFSGKEIRKRILNNEKWDDLVPDEVYNFLIKKNGPKRIKDISEKPV